MSYYSVNKGKIPGIYTSWNDCKKQIDKFEGAIFKKFNNKIDAEKFLKEGFLKKPKFIVKRENDDNKNNSNIENETDNYDDKIYIYTDGSLIKFKNNISKAGIGIYIPFKNIKVSKPYLNDKITNNRAEMVAIIDSISLLDEEDLCKKICIFTDSQYCIYIFTGTGERYESNGYKNNGADVPNIDLIKKILEIKRKYNIVLLKIRSHTDKKDEHSLGNQIADKLATEGAHFETKKNNIFFDNERIINENIQMNELFEFGESDVIVPKIILSKKNKPLKNPKLSNWFIKS